MKKQLVLAFDIERSGATSTYETIAIGASVVDSNFKEQDRLFLSAYFPPKSDEPTLFEPRCWNQFWIHQQDILKQLIYEGSLLKKERQKEMIVQFQAFRSKWETYAKEHNMDYILVSDNPIYDGGFINEMIFQHLPDTLPIPYNACNGEYSSFLDTHSAIWGLFIKCTLAQKIKQIYSWIPSPKEEHDHRPDHDAFVIAYEQQMLFLLRENSMSIQEQI